jgi:8-oxo-dGTP diphosphatase
MTHRAAIDVAVAIVRSGDGRVLLAERTARQAGAGYWELPGGKIEAGETPASAAQRELSEEVGIAARAMRPAIVYEHAFTTKRVRLHFFRVDEWSGTPHGREGQRLSWVDAARPDVAPILPSNERILLALGLPALYIPMPGRERADEFIDALPRLLARRAALIGVREPQLGTDQRITFARRIVEITRRLRTGVVVSGSAQEAHRAGALGIHSTAAELNRLRSRPPVRFWLASCHDAAGAERAVALGADAALISPIRSSPADCARAPLGWDELARLAARLPIPVYAGGGMTPDLLPAAVRAGAIGIAADQIDACAPSAGRSSTVEFAAP